MTITPLPSVPAKAILAADDGSQQELVEFLIELVNMLQSQINELTQVCQKAGRPMQFPLFTKDQLLNGPFPMRIGDVPHMCYIPDLNGDPALVISDGTNLRTITIGPTLS